jgi:flagellar hook protein FlgE
VKIKIIKNQRAMTISMLASILLINQWNIPRATELWRRFKILETRKMTIYSAFSIPTLGMMAQSHALNNIGNNIANATTGGFKRTDTNFSTLLSSSLDKQSDLGGIAPKDFNRIAQSGNIVGSDRDLDMAINGQGFFILNSDVNGTGQAYYGRDGSFDIAAVNDITVAGIGGKNITTKDGYLIDKNGYFLQGWTPDPTTGLYTNKTLSSLRVDDYAFAATNKATTNAYLELNLPASASPGLAQVAEHTLSGTVETGDTFDVTVEDTTVTYTVAATDTSLNDIRTGLIAAVNANTTISALAEASASSRDGKILISGATQGTALTVSTATTNVAAGTSDNQISGAIIQDPTANDTHYYNMGVIDANGVTRSAKLNFAKTATNTWQFSTSIGKTPVSQVDTVTLAGTIDAGDAYTVVVDGKTFSQTVAAVDTLTTVRDALIASINASADTNVTAATSGTDALTLTADTAGTTFTSNSSTTNTTAVAQIDNVTISGTYAVGDQISVDVNAIGPVVYSVVGNDLTLNGDGTGGAIAGNSTAAFNNITKKIAAAIVADGPTSGVVTAADTGSGTGVITMTAVTAGTAFTQVKTITSATGLVSLTTPTPNIAANADDDATKVNTTANVSGTELTETAIGTITFNADGTLATPTTGLFDLTLNFPANGTVAATTETVALDISKFVQFDGGFQTFTFSKNGYATATTQSIKFDGNGNVIAGFDDATYRSVYRIPLAQFFNANGLQEYNGNVYRATENSGTASIIDVNSSDYASFSINAHELSNVNLTGEFTRMMMTQTAYNSSSTVFKTVDEMVATARDLKR